jgi:hypothetical protein
VNIKMQIRLTVEHLPAAIKFFEKHGITMHGTEFVENGTKKRKKFLTQTEKNAIAAIKDRARGRQKAVAEEYNVAPSVIAKIWQD